MEAEGGVAPVAVAALGAQGRLDPGDGEAALRRAGRRWRYAVDSAGHDCAGRVAGCPRARRPGSQPVPLEPVFLATLGRMLSDLSVAAMVGAVALLVIAGVMTWVARGADDGRLPFGGRVSIRTATTRRSPEALLVGNRAAAPFLRRYAVILAVLAALVLLLSFVSDIAALAVHLLAVVALVLAVMVCLKKADAAAAPAPTDA